MDTWVIQDSKGSVIGIVNSAADALTAIGRLLQQDVVLGAGSGYLYLARVKELRESFKKVIDEGATSFGTETAYKAMKPETLV